MCDRVRYHSYETPVSRSQPKSPCPGPGPVALRIFCTPFAKTTTPVEESAPPAASLPFFALRPTRPPRGGRRIGSCPEFSQLTRTVRPGATQKANELIAYPCPRSFLIFACSSADKC